jgi:hypothetical protein
MIADRLNNEILSKYLSLNIILLDYGNKLKKTKLGDSHIEIMFKHIGAS